MKISKGWVLGCTECNHHLDSDPPNFTCPRCNGLLQLTREAEAPSKSDLFPLGNARITQWRYRKAFPLPQDVNPVSLEEGGTPLVKSVHLAKELGIERLYIKNEGQNPTGSFKDRGMTVAVTRAVDSQAKLLICASTGNTSASLAAYAARAGVTAIVVIPSGKVAKGKLAQAAAHGAKMIRVDGGFDAALSLAVRTIFEEPDLYLMNSVNPYRIEGQKTVAFEIYEQLQLAVPDYLVLPVGNAGNISAVWKGFTELALWGMTTKLPVLIGVQAAGASPVVDAFAKGANHVAPVENPSTIASAIRIGNPVSWKKALKALAESHGMALSVSDEEIIQARQELASREGLFVEAASATTIAALKKLGEKIDKKSTVVCIATGHGLKDQETIQVDVENLPVVSDSRSLRNVLGQLTQP